MKTTKNLYTCDRCGKTFTDDEKDKDFKPFSIIQYRFNDREYVYKQYYSKSYTLNGKWDDVHLCEECSKVFNTLLGLFGFEKLKERTFSSTPDEIIIKK